MVHLAVPLCRWSWHPLPSVFTQRLCIHIHSIAFLACCSNLAEESFIQSASRAMGNCGTCCIGRGKEVGMADDADVSFIRCAETSWQRLVTEVSDTSLPSFSSIKRWLKNALIKNVGRKWFPFRRFFLNGWTVHCFESDECTPTFSLFRYWQDPITLPCVTACEANTTYYNIIFCQCLRSSSYSFRHVMLATIHALSSLSWFAPWWSARFSNLTLQIIESKILKHVQNVRPGCQPKLAIAQGEPAWNQRCVRGQGFSSVQYMRCRMDLKRFNSHFLQRSRSLQASIFAFWWVLSIRRIELIYDTIFGLNNKCTIYYFISFNS